MRQTDGHVDAGGRSIRTPSADRARAVVGPAHEPSAKYRSYLRLRRAYEAAIRRREEARVDAGRDPKALQQWPITGRTYDREVDSALDQWLTAGHKAEIEAALRVLATHDRT